MQPFFVIVVMALEATVVGLPLTALTDLGMPWPLLLLAVALGWLSARLARHLAPGRQRIALLAGATVGGLLLPSVHLGGPRAAMSALLPGRPAFLAAYGLLLLGLYLFWRGSRLDTRDGDAIGRLFRYGTAAGVVAMVLGAVAGSGAPAGAPTTLAYVIGLITLGLLALALAHAQATTDGHPGAMSWRWLATLLAAVALVVGVAAMGISLVGQGDGIQTAQTLLGYVLLPFALIGAALAWLFLTFLGAPITALIRMIAARLQLTQPPEASPTEVSPTALWPDSPLTAIERIAAGATFLVALIPIIILVAAILLLRLRRPAGRAGDEERESLGVIASLGADLHDLLGRLRNPLVPRRDGLHAALARLRGDDPSTRVRRAYIGLLLLLEGRDRPRPPALTPTEFAPAAIATTEAPEPVGTITAAYEQARYNPAGAGAAAAADAETALRHLERQS